MEAVLTSGCTAHPEAFAEQGQRFQEPQGDEAQAAGNRAAVGKSRKRRNGAEKTKTGGDTEGFANSRKLLKEPHVDADVRKGGEAMAPRPSGRFK